MNDHAQASITTSASSGLGDAAQAAPALRQVLHRFVKLRLQLRDPHVFRDTSSLVANPSLWSSIEKSFSQFKYFILLALRKAAASVWVGKVATFWDRTEPAENTLVVLSTSEIAWDTSASNFDWNRTIALPPNPQGFFGEEPRWMDLRCTWKAKGDPVKHAKFSECVADLAARRPVFPTIGTNTLILPHSRHGSRGRCSTSI